jgi:hypothetical protein
MYSQKRANFQKYDGVCFMKLHVLKMSIKAKSIFLLFSFTTNVKVIELFSTIILFEFIIRVHMKYKVFQT